MARRARRVNTVCGPARSQRSGSVRERPSAIPYVLSRVTLVPWSLQMLMRILSAWSLSVTWERDDLYFNIAAKPVVLISLLSQGELEQPLELGGYRREFEYFSGRPLRKDPSQAVFLDHPDGYERFFFPHQRG